ncbi:pancreatic triacylglycerol lipase-like [Physella acuta]|uniref:pancreatic triacylglycerol lipase-like n=1 Tax=Physella acuta TaxID=109671 RepID=UPI0027DC51D0|nr:pancreatic triacylglycerol lipase-like [Physella acuta]
MELSLLVCLALLSGAVYTANINKREVACYPDVGCFANEGPFAYSPQRPLTVVPESPQKVGTIYRLYTRESKTTAQVLDALHFTSAGTVFTNFKPRNTKILVHGFLDSPQMTSWHKDLTAAFLSQGDYNVISVDWSKGNLFPYTQATANTRIVGAQIALLVHELIKTKNVTAADFHIIGHSLGSHISGYAGERIPGLGRITGLDPAGPYFENTDPAVRLDPTDAVFVDAMHTDAEKLIYLGLGMKQAVADIDFYPNSGHDQPGCTRNPFTNIAEWGVLQGSIEVICCNHFRAVHFFIESVKSDCPFMGYTCNNEADFENGKCNTCGTAGCSFMGLHADRNIPARGSYRKVYLHTANHQPFCQFHLDVTLKLQPNVGQTTKGAVAVVINGDKGSTNRVQLNAGAINFEPGSVHTFQVATPNDIGNIRNIMVIYMHTVSLLNPLDWDILGLTSSKIYLQEVDVKRQEAGVESRVCAAGSGVVVESDKAVVINRAC